MLLSVSLLLARRRCRRTQKKSNASDRRKPKATPTPIPAFVPESKELPSVVADRVGAGGIEIAMVVDDDVEVVEADAEVEDVAEVDLDPETDFRSCGAGA